MLPPVPGPHRGHTEVRVVRNVSDRQSEDFMVDCSAGEPGLMICAGDNLMQGYVGKARLQGLSN